MNGITPDQAYWSQRWLNRDTTWDVGYPSTPIKEFIDGITDKTLRILVPGCGNAYEAEYFHRSGFTHVDVVDFAPEALAQFRQRVPDFPENHLLCEDFFKLTGTWDLVIEQTFFCAIDPSQRDAYARKMSTLLAPGGRLAGLLFNDTLNTDKPPYGGTAAEYEAIFRPHFTLIKMEPAQNSIPPRAGRELFIDFLRKSDADA
jgi:methyl halide transferase